MTSEARGDIFGLAQRREQGLNFGHVRKRLRQGAGVPPQFPSAKRGSKAPSPGQSIAQRWASRPVVRPNSLTWRYLALKRGLPGSVIQAATDACVLREGPPARVQGFPEGRREIPIRLPAGDPFVCPSSSRRRRSIP